MKSTVAFYKCEKCGNIVELIKNSGQPVVCCGQDMTKLEAQTADATTEKHVPVATREGDKINVVVGSTAHPMLDAHYIEWIVLVTDDGIERINLSPGDEPKAVFCDREGSVDVYEYCNLHGLWKSTL